MSQTLTTPTSAATRTEVLMQQGNDAWVICSMDVASSTYHDKLRSIADGDDTGEALTLIAVPNFDENRLYTQGHAQRRYNKAFDVKLETFYADGRHRSTSSSNNRSVKHWQYLESGHDMDNYGSVVALRLSAVQDLAPIVTLGALYHQADSPWILHWGTHSSAAQVRQEIKDSEDVSTILHAMLADSWNSSHSIILRQSRLSRPLAQALANSLNSGSWNFHEGSLTSAVGDQEDQRFELECFWAPKNPKAYTPQLQSTVDSCTLEGVATLADALATGSTESGSTVALRIRPL